MVDRINDNIGGTISPRACTKLALCCLRTDPIIGAPYLTEFIWRTSPRDEEHARLEVDPFTRYKAVFVQGLRYLYLMERCTAVSVNGLLHDNQLPTFRFSTTKFTLEKN